MWRLLCDIGGAEGDHHAAQYANSFSLLFAG